MASLCRGPIPGALAERFFTYSWERGRLARNFGIEEKRKSCGRDAGAPRNDRLDRMAKNFRRIPPAFIRLLKRLPPFEAAFFVCLLIPRREPWKIMSHAGAPRFSMSASAFS
jgi:hypothetical protein